MPQPIVTQRLRSGYGGATSSDSPRQRVKNNVRRDIFDPSTCLHRIKGDEYSDLLSSTRCTGVNASSPAVALPIIAGFSGNYGLISTSDRTAAMSHSTSDLIEAEKDALLQDTPSSSGNYSHSRSARSSFESATTVSTTSLVLENLNENARAYKKRNEDSTYRDDESDPEVPATKWSRRNRRLSNGNQSSVSRSLKRILLVTMIVAVSGWVFALFNFISNKTYQHGSTQAYDHEKPVKSSGKKITLEEIQGGEWYAKHKDIHWIAGANGEDGLLLEIERAGGDFMVVEDVRSRKADYVGQKFEKQILMKSDYFIPKGGQSSVMVEQYWPSPDLKKVLILSYREKVYRHSFTGIYYVFDVATQEAEYLDETHPYSPVQLATWSPTGDSIAFTRDNNLHIRLLKDSNGQATTAVRAITEDGGPEYFYGIPDWVYEEEVFQGNSATWWDRQGKYLAFMRTNETMVPEFPVDYYLSRPSGKAPEAGLENYPDEKRIKYPKAGAPNPVVDMLFYDVDRNEMYSVNIDNGFEDDDRIIADVLWADNGRVIVKELNRVSDKVRVVLVDAKARTGRTIRTLDIQKIDNGWVEPGQESRYVPADPANGRPEEGYIDMVLYDNGDHIGYFSPLDNPEPLMLTKGAWEVEQGTVNLDLRNNQVYFTAAKEHSTQRHVYSVDLAGKEIKPIVPVDKPGYYSASFSAEAGYAIVNYEGPGIPSQKVISTPSNPDKFEEVLETNDDLAKRAAQHEMPHVVHTNFTAEDGTVLNVVELRPPHFDPKRQYPVLFQLYGGPGSQQVNRRFRVNFQSYVASSLGYLVVTLDNRGTGFIGRKARTIIRGNIGHYEAIDQIACAEEWASKSYVDAERLAIWGWSYGGFMTLKVLEMDAGRTFKYGMAVAPVTDFRFYDSIYTERYMFTPQTNPDGYDETAITNITALSENVRWLMMHGTGDDNVHVQNTLTLIDKLDMEGIKNYDVHFFPDSDHSIYFHGANQVVYGKLSQFLVNAFNGVFYEMKNPKPDYTIGVDDESR